MDKTPAKASNTQQMDDDSHLWFVIDRNSHKADEVGRSPHEMWSPAMNALYLAMTAMTGDVASLSDNRRMELDNKRGAGQ